MKRVVRLTERDLNRIVKRIINEDRERYTLDEIEDMEGKSGTWEVVNGALILKDDSNLEMQIVEFNQ